MKAITEKCCTVKKIISAITFCTCIALFVNQLIICIEKFHNMETLIKLELVRWVKSYIQQQTKFSCKILLFYRIILQIYNCFTFEQFSIYANKQGELVTKSEYENSVSKTVIPVCRV